jgi:signal transduction histidine kinase
VTAAEGRVLITVEDQGEGIVPGDMERIFDVYATTGGEHGQGAGLGLPLSRRLARLLGGELHAVPRPGRGGCFVLELPAEKGLAEGQT